MRRRVHVSEASSAELYEAVRWYEAQRPGLGNELFGAVSRALELIGSSPEAGGSSTTGGQTRRMLVERFPYQIVYRIRRGEIEVVAVAHLKRRPGDWRKRSHT